MEAVIKWAALHVNVYPELEYLHHVPNGGKRDIQVAIALKKQGVKAGAPDLYLDVARCGYHGLRIEMKRRDGTGTISDDQLKFHAFLRNQGYLVIVLDTWEHVTEFLKCYLKSRIKHR